MHRVMFHRDHEKGAVAIIVALLFGFGIMTAAAALTIDVGRINAERRQLQNGADSVALAVAQTCAKAGSTCPNSYGLVGDANLQSLANANAADGFTQIGRVDLGTPAICGFGANLTACPASWTLSTTNLQECPDATIPAGAKGYVRVYTQTSLDASGTKTLLPYSFGAAIAGVGSGAKQQTCAAVAWGRPGPAGSAAPIALSFCDWKAATGYVDAPTPPATTPAFNPGIFAPSPVPPDPGYTSASGASQPHWPAPAQVPPVAGQEIVVNLQGDSKTDKCANWQGADAPGGFGWLNQTGPCVASDTNGGWIQVSTGTGDQCKTTAGNTDLSKLFEKVIFLPVYDCVYGSGTMPTFTPTKTTVCAPAPGTGPGGSNVWYHIEGYASFYVSGWYFTGSDNQASPTNGLAPTCAKSTCISGWFTQGLLNEPITIDTTTGGGPGLGAWTLQNLG